MSCGSGESLNDSVTCGLRPNVRQMRPMVVRLMPAFDAIVRVLQWVSPAGVVSRVFTSAAAVRLCGVANDPRTSIIATARVLVRVAKGARSPRLNPTRHLLFWFLVD